MIITSIKKDGIEQIPLDNPDLRLGYSDPREFLPQAIIGILDKAFK